MHGPPLVSSSVPLSLFLPATESPIPALHFLLFCSSKRSIVELGLFRLGLLLPRPLLLLLVPLLALDQDDQTRPVLAAQRYRTQNELIITIFPSILQLQFCPASSVTVWFLSLSLITRPISPTAQGFQWSLQCSQLQHLIQTPAPCKWSQWRSEIPRYDSTRPERATLRQPNLTLSLPQPDTPNLPSFFPSTDEAIEQFGSFVCLFGICIGMALADHLARVQ